MCKYNGGRNSKTQQITTIGRTNTNTTENQKTTEVSKKELQYYSGKVQILTDLLQSYFALHSGRKIKSYCGQYHKNMPKYPKYSRMFKILKLQK